jgi:hypothetical protein
MDSCSLLYFFLDRVLQSNLRGQVCPGSMQQYYIKLGQLNN